MKALFPPANFEHARDGLTRVLQETILTGLGILLVCSLTILGFLVKGATWLQFLASSLLIGVYLVVGSIVLWGLQGWFENKVIDVWDNHDWETERDRGDDASNLTKIRSHGLRG